jgi:chromate transporter
MGATGFGGAMVLIGLMQRDLVEKEQVVSPELFGEGVAVGQILPGPVAVNCAGYLGFRLRGLLGALVTVVCLILPPFLLMLILTPLYLAHGTVPQVAGFFKGVTPAVVAVILATGWRMGGKFVKGWTAGAIAVLVAAGAISKLSPLLLVLGAGLLGMVFRWPKKAEGAEAQ